MQSPVADAFAALVRSDPAAPLAWTAAGGRTRSDLAALAAQVASRIAGLPPGACVAISVRDGFLFLAAVLAAWQRSACVVMLDAADPRAPRLDQARQFGAAGLVTDQPDLRYVPLDGNATADGLAAIKLTSGSTDQPRGVGVRAAELIADCDALRVTMGIRDDDRIFAAVPMSFSYGIGSVLMPALWRGQCVVLPDHRHPLGLLQAIGRGAPTVLPAVPALLRALLAAKCDLGGDLRLVLSAGAALQPATASAFRTLFQLPVHAFYGSTESGGICYDRTGLAAERGSVGTPVEGVVVTLDPSERVVVRSAAVGIAVPADPDLRDGVFTSSDLAAWSDGELVLLGRTSDVFDVGGHKVHPRQVEGVIAALAGVRDAVVVPWRDASGRAVCAALVVAAGVDETAIRHHCVRHLPAAKVPRCIRLVAELPCTSRGKVARAEIDRLLQAAGDDGASGRNV